MNSGKKVVLKFYQVYANICWRWGEAGEEHTCRSYLTLGEQERDRAELKSEGWEVCPSMGLYHRTFAKDAP